MRSESGNRPTPVSPADAANPDCPLSDPLSVRLKTHTRGHHRRAERTGVVRAITTGTVTPSVYRRYLRNLIPIYDALERRLKDASASVELSPLAAPAILRAPALRSDLEALAGPNWSTELTEVPACQRYVADIETATLAGLIGHAYVRYLGDLNGGAVLRRLLQRTLHLPDRHLAFFAFPGIEDRAVFTERVRARIDALLPESEYGQALTAAARAFELNIALANEVSLGSKTGDATNKRAGLQDRA